MNSIERIYRLRGKQVHLRELADLAAVRAERAGRNWKLTPAALESIAPELDLPQVRALEDAGWVFVPRDRAQDGAAVYLRPSGRLALGTNRLTVRVAGNRSADEAQTFLVQHGFGVVDRLKFAPNLFLVEVPAGHDPVEEAERLTASGEVEFAEPEMIETIHGR